MTPKGTIYFCYKNQESTNLSNILQVFHYNVYTVREIIVIEYVNVV